MLGGQLRWQNLKKTFPRDMANARCFCRLKKKDGKNQAAQPPSQKKRSP